MIIINNLALGTDTEGALDYDGTLRVSICKGSAAAYLGDEEAMQLMEHLVKVFKFSDYEIGGLQSAD